MYLVIDIAWFGLALAATSRFLSLYAMRLGADSSDLSLLASLPGAVLLISTGLSGWWRRHFQESLTALIWPGALFRLVFLLPMFAPFFPKEWQPAWLIASAVIPALPQGIAGAIFIVLMRETVSEERLPALLSQRALAMNITVGIGAIAFGLLLEAVPFPYNYQLMFFMAFAFAMVSQWSVMRLNVIFPTPIVEKPKQSIWRNPSFRPVALAAFLTHFTFFAIIMVTPERLVNELNATEGFMAMFGLIELVAGALAATVSARIIKQLGPQATTGIAMMGTALAALIIATAPSLQLTLIAAGVSGATWTIATIALFALLVERTPSEDSSHSSVAYQQVLSMGIFLGPLVGGLLVSNGIGLTNMLMIGAMMRFAAGIFTYQTNQYPLRTLHSRSRRR